MINHIYQIVIGIVGRHEHQAEDEIKVLDRIFCGSNW